VTWTSFGPLRKWTDGARAVIPPERTDVTRPDVPPENELVSWRLIKRAARLVSKLPGAGRVGRAATWLLELGTSGYPDDVRIRLKIMNAIAYLIVVTTTIYTVQHAFLDFQKFYPLVILNASLIFVAMLVPAAHRINEIAAKHGLASGDSFIEAEFLAGWVALRYLNKPQAALRHFLALRKAATFAKKPSSNDKTPASLDDVLGAGRLVFDAENVFYVDCEQPKPGIYNSAGKVFIYPLKTRYSAAGSSGQRIELCWYPACGRIEDFRDIEPQQDADDDDVPF